MTPYDISPEIIDNLEQQFKSAGMKRGQMILALTALTGQLIIKEFATEDAREVAVDQLMVFLKNRVLSQ